MAEKQDTKKKRLALDPDLADGQHWTIHDEPNQVLVEVIKAWMEEAVDGDEITIRLVEMTDSEAARLPDI